MATGLRSVAERVGDGAGQPVLDVDGGEELVHIQPGVSIVLGNRPPESPGTLYITTKQLVWFSDADRTKGYAVDFFAVSLHAVSRDPEAYSAPCIYTQIETGDGQDDMDNSDSEDDGILNLSKITEMRLVPSDPNQLGTLFAMFCECAELNPDPIKEDEVVHNWVFNVGELEDNAGEDGDDPEWSVPQNPTHSIGVNGSEDLAHSVVQLQINDHRFEDAEEMEHDEKNGYH